MNATGPVTQLHFSTQAQASKAKNTPAELKKAVTEFEALFLNQMLKVMRDTVVKSDLFHGGSGEEIYNSLFDTELSGQMAKGGGIGLGKVLLGQLEGNLAAAAGQDVRAVEKALENKPGLQPAVAIKTEGIQGVK